MRVLRVEEGRGCGICDCHDAYDCGFGFDEQRRCWSGHLHFFLIRHEEVRYRSNERWKISEHTEIVT